MNEYLNMGGYGAYVWPAWGIAALVLAVLIVISVRSLRLRERELARLEADMPRRKRRNRDRPVTDGPEKA